MEAGREREKMKLNIYLTKEQYTDEDVFIVAPNSLQAVAVYRNERMCGEAYSVSAFKIGEIEVSKSALEKLIAPEKTGKTEPIKLTFPTRREFIPRSE